MKKLSLYVCLAAMIAITGAINFATGQLHLTYRSLAE